MADALCGPSNPLQTFQKTTSVDRTLQQDRLRSRLPPHAAQGFRSHDPRTGSLDAEFAAFEAGQPFDQTIAPPPPNSQLFSPAHLQQNGLQQDVGSASWAADFQRLRLSSPGPVQSPVPQAQFRHEAPMHRSTPAAGWHTEFMKHQQTSVAGGMASTAPMTQKYSPGNMFSGALASSPLVGHEHYQSHGLYPATQYSQSQEDQKNQTQPNGLDEAAFEAAFAEAASADLQANSSSSQAPQTMTTDSTDFQSVSTSQSQISNLPKIGSDLIPPKPQFQASQIPDQQQAQQNADTDADSLALTAGELLHSVKDDSSDKFRQSNFLALMRRLRDREVVVRGDDIVENPTQNQHQDQSESEQHPEPLTSVPANVPPAGRLLYSESAPEPMVMDVEEEASALHPGGPSYPSPPPEEHFLDTFPNT